MAEKIEHSIGGRWLELKPVAAAVAATFGRATYRVHGAPMTYVRSGIMRLASWRPVK